MTPAELEEQPLRWLITDLDEDRGYDVKQAWIEKAHRRYKELKDSAVTAIPANEAIEKARDRLRSVR